MRSPWNSYGFQLHKMFSLFVSIFLFQIRHCWSINLEGIALLNFRANVDSDPFDVFLNWNPEDHDPCMWSGVHCEDGKVQILDLSGFSLGGTLSPELGKLTHMKSLFLQNNHFIGGIPKEFGDLTMLELLDLSSNNFSGLIPAEIGQMVSLRRLLLSNNKFHGIIPLEIENLDTLSEIQFDQNLTFSVVSGVRCLHRKFGHCIWQKSLKQLKEDSLKFQIKKKFQNYIDVLPWFSRKSSTNVCGESYCENVANTPDQNPENLVSLVRRSLLQDLNNLPAVPVSVSMPSATTTVTLTRSSGSFPAIPKQKTVDIPHDPPAHKSPPIAHVAPSPPSSSYWEKYWTFIISGICGGFFFIIALLLLIACRRRGVKTIRPWKTGISGQLQKAFVTGVPKLNRPELESACEDFSNIIATLENMTVYKGTLSSGVEIAVASTCIKAYKDWSSRSETAFRKKIDSLSRMNHKNFVNLLGYCEENEPFTRMMVFEYAPSGSLFEHLHVKEMEHLDWNMRMRVIMGVAYCLQYTHELNPPIAIDGIKSNWIFLSDDFAAKVAEMRVWADVRAKSKMSGELPKSKLSGELSEYSELPSSVDPETNVYGFGLLCLEIISGKLPYSEKEGPLLDWASEYLKDRRNYTELTDPTLKTFKNSELETLCDVIKECIHHDSRQRPTMKEIIFRLREVINIPPEAATPRLSPLWWAELELLSVEAT